MKPKKKIRQKKPEKKIEEDNKNNKNYHDKTRKKIVKTHEEKKLNPALNHAAIIRKQKKAVRSPPYPNNYEYPN